MTAKLEDLAKHRKSRRQPGGRQPAASKSAAAPKRGCPICGRPVVERHRPFCSTRCADIDLGRWLNEVYRAPAAESEPPSSSEPTDED
jgi:endogenous inhibitor of DNA gyrase (YacG/DUF329 family)